MSQKNSLVGLYPGTFNPLTFGHMDIIKRAAALVDTLIIGVAESPHKKTLLDMKTRITLVEENIPEGSNNIKVIGFENLLMNFAKENNVNIIFRGLRGTPDFDYEFQMANMNSVIAEGIETVFLMANNKHQFIASKFVREMARLGADISPFVPTSVEAKLKEHY